MQSKTVGAPVAGAYNALLKEISAVLAGEDLAGKGIIQVAHSDNGDSVRLLVGQLKLIVGNG